MTTIAMADDHVMLRQGLANMIESFGDFKILLQAGNGKELVDALAPEKLPKLALLDISMPVMDGFEAASILQKKFSFRKGIGLKYDGQREPSSV